MAMVLQGSKLILRDGNGDDAVNIGMNVAIVLLVTTSEVDDGASLVDLANILGIGNFWRNERGQRSSARVNIHERENLRVTQARRVALA